MNQFDNKSEAKVEYLSGDLRVVKPGAFVTCAVSGARIPLDHLTYWNPDKQEAYASYAEAAKAIGFELRASED